MRDKLIWTLLLMIATGAALANFMGGAAITEKEGFAIVFGSAGLRFLKVLGIVLFVCFYVRRAFETKEVEFLLSRPISRGSFLFSHAIAFMILSVLATLAVVLSVYIIGRPDPAGLFAWGMSICVENMIMAIAALFFSMVLSSAAGSALATLGFYVLSRLIGTLIGISALAPKNWIFAVMNNVLDVISIIVPRLDMVGQTSWLVYGVEGAGGFGFLNRAGTYSHFLIEHLGVCGFVLTQGFLFIGLLLSATAFDFQRRQF
jgi:ABC-type transport system involved in multi-copper enzyme maturation permease subunit